MYHYSEKKVFITDFFYLCFISDNNMYYMHVLVKPGGGGGGGGAGWNMFYKNCFLLQKNYLVKYVIAGTIEEEV